MNKKDYEHVSDIFKSLSHPMRLQIVHGLMSNTCCVNDIAKKLNAPQSTVSQHLAHLRVRGIVYPEKQGLTTCYRIKDEKIKKLIEIW